MQNRARLCIKIRHKSQNLAKDSTLILDLLQSWTCVYLFTHMYLSTVLFTHLLSIISINDILIVMLSWAFKTAEQISPVEIRACLNPRDPGLRFLHFEVFEKRQSRQWNSVAGIFGKKTATQMFL